MRETMRGGKKNKVSYSFTRNVQIHPVQACITAVTIFSGNANEGI